RPPPDCHPPTSPRTKDPRTKEMTREHQDARAIRPEMEPVHAQRADRGVARHPTPGIVLLACATTCRRRRLRPGHWRARLRQIRHLAHPVGVACHAAR